MAGCTTQAWPGGATPIPSAGGLSVSLLAEDGPRTTGPPNLVVARSVPELKALLRGLRDVRFHDPDGWDGFAPDKGKVFIALAGGSCRRITLVTATKDKRGTVLIDYRTEAACSQGAGSAATPRLFLASIPRSQLGTGVVTFQISGGFGRARVDLRPAFAESDPASVARDAAQAVMAVRRKVVMWNSAPVRELDLLRWPDTGLDCGPMAASSTALPVIGYVVVVEKGSGQPSQPEEFHWSAGQVVDCGPATGV